VHAVILDALRPHGEERPGPDVQREGSDPDAPRLQRVDQRRREVEACRRGRDRATLARASPVAA